MDSFRIRPWLENDAAPLLELMMALAEFEGYSEDFRVTQQALLQNGRGDDRRFEALVAEEVASGALLGMAVTYQQSWTYDLQPTVVLKELFVAPEARRLGLGAKLFEAVKDRARDLGASRINWTVLAGNDRAKAFYRDLGGTHDEKWEPWTLTLTDQD